MRRRRESAKQPARARSSPFLFGRSAGLAPRAAARPRGPSRLEAPDIRTEADVKHHRESSSSASCPSRRRFLTALAAIGIGTTACSQNLPATASNPGDQIPDSGNHGRINVHQSLWTAHVDQGAGRGGRAQRRTVEGLEPVPDLSTPWIGTSRRLFESPEKPPEKLSLLRKYYYDTAASANFFQMQTLKTLIGISQVVLGDDHPYGEPLTYVKALKELANDGTLTVPEVNAVLRENMLRYMPQLKRYRA